ANFHKLQAEGKAIMDDMEEKVQGLVRVVNKYVREKETARTP
ncbi:hypothetical protein LCGC14_2961090, partial [marine sediment metagenome]